uniref:Restriction endonuclease type IV Mrr domain-containing protein n=1 Tax=Megaviridae environmental sample TaxID=1737588 RepID=A0A5J6VJB2_9VIRU|nr:MAG: hypothetical protein [Megaviridae environmental sample]
MNTLTCKIILNKEEYPILTKLKKSELNGVILEIFNTGYKCIYPKEINTNIKNNELLNKINTLETTLERLIGLSSTSSKKGELGEALIEEQITQKYGDIKYTDMSKTSHSGDAWIKFDSLNDKIMLEIKNYTNKVNKDEIIKMKNDMKTNNINWGVFISWNSGVNNYREFDIDTFNHQGQVYTIIIISNLSNDVDRLDMGMQLIKKLIQNYSNSEKFPWVTNKIKSDLEKLNEIIMINYQLRDWFNEMENSIKGSLNKYYTKLRDYQLEIDSLVKNITNNINGTIEESIISPNFNFENILEKYKDNKKLLPMLSKIIDKLQKNNIYMTDFNENNLYKDQEKIGNIKIQTKKILLIIHKYNMTLEYSFESNDSALNVLDSLL